MTLHHRTFLLVAALALALLTANTANAAQRFFSSPTGNIGCELDYKVPGISARAYCQTFKTPKSITLSANGKIKRCYGERCLGNGPENAFTLAYGRSVRLGPFRCLSTRAGMSCRIVKTGRGFRISRDRILVFTRY